MVAGYVQHSNISWNSFSYILRETFCLFIFDKLIELQQQHEPLYAEMSCAYFFHTAFGLIEDMHPVGKYLYIF